jgi:hypothetical protein
MDGFTVVGDHGYTACELQGGAAGSLSSRIEVVEGVPALFAAIGDPLTGGLLDPARAQLTITAPDGSSFGSAANS